MKQTSEETAVHIGKFDILATYSYAHALLDGHPDDEARQRGIVAAIMGARARQGIARDFHATKTEAERKKKSSITAESFDHQVSEKMGEFFGAVFLPAMSNAVERGLSYDAVKRIVKIPSTWGAKITGEQFQERWKKASKAK